MPTELEGDLSRITCNPGVLGGKPIVRGTRVPVARVLEQIEVEGWSGVFAAFPMLSEDDVRACIRYARLAVTRHERLRGRRHSVAV